jgi:hypothetical protein
VICATLDDRIRIYYTLPEHDHPAELWNAITRDFEKQICLNGLSQISNLANSKLESHASVLDWIAAQEKVCKDQLIYSIEIPPTVWIYWILGNLLPGNQWKNLHSTLEITGKTEQLHEPIDYLVSFECKIKYEGANLITNREKGKHALTMKRRSQPNPKTKAITNGKKPANKCSFCKNRGHIVTDCQNLVKKNEWKTESAKVVVEDSDDDFLLLINHHANVLIEEGSHPEVNLMKDSYLNSPWICDSGATRHIYRECNLFIDYRAANPSIHSLRADNHVTILVQGTGNIRIINDGHSLTLSNVLHTPASMHNLVNLAALAHKGVNITISMQGLRVMKDNSLLFQASNRYGLYSITSWCPIQTDLVNISIHENPHDIFL